MKKKAPIWKAKPAADPRPEYGFTHGLRGKYHKALREGYTIGTYGGDGTIVERILAGKSTVPRVSDVCEYFRTPRAVNDTLRALISTVAVKKALAAQKECCLNLATKSRARRAR